jgi:hypothetical protein
METRSLLKICIYYFLINIFYKNKKLKLFFGDQVTAQNDFIFLIWREYALPRQGFTGAAGEPL